MCVLLIRKFIVKFVFSNAIMQCTFSINKMKYFSRDWILSTATGELMPSSILEKATLQGLYFD